MKKLLMWGIFLFLSVSLFSQTFNKNSMIKNELQWSQVKQNENDRLPKSAAQVVDHILKNAIAKKDVPQVIKALIYKNKYKLELDEEQNTLIVDDLNKLLSTTTDIADKALLNSMLAELYLNYYQTDSWTFDQRTGLGDFVPEDMKEWSSNIFFDKVLYHLRESVKDAGSLLSRTTQSYHDIIDLGNDSPLVYPTLYDFLMRRAIDKSKDITSNYKFQSGIQNSLKKRQLQIVILSQESNDFVKNDFSGDNNLLTLQFYKEFLQSLADRKMLETIILTEITKNEYLSSISEDYCAKYAYQFLLSLEKKYQPYEFNVEIINSIINFVEGYDDAALKQKYDWCKYGIEKYPDYKRIALLQNILLSIESPLAYIRGKDILSPNQKVQQFELKYKNLDKANVFITKININGTDTIYQPYKNFVIDLAPENSYTTYSKQIDLDIKELGNYLMQVEFDDKKTSKDSVVFSISNLAPFCRSIDNKQYEFYVVDRMTGNPLKKAKVDIFKKDKHIITLFTDNHGFATFTSDEELNNDYSLSEQYKYVVSYNDDNPGIFYNLPFEYSLTPASRSSENKLSENIQIFTDRSIYRPGQTLYFKVIAFNIANNEYTTPQVNKPLEISLYDVNNQLVGQKTLITNDFGSVAGEFILPKTGLTGSFYVRVGDQSVYVNVEEYKRPTFQVTFDKIDKTYAFGDKVTLVGHAENFSGVKLGGVDVQIQVTKNHYWYWNAYPEAVETANVKTNADGSFEFVFIIPKTEKGKVPHWRNIYRFSVSATVTDANGETQEGDYSFSVGDVSLMLNTNLTANFDKKSDKTIEIASTNLDGQVIPTQGTFAVFSLYENDSIKSKVFSGEFKTGIQSDLKNRLSEQPSGKYKIILSAKDSNGRDVESENNFVLYSLDDKCPPIDTNEWFLSKKAEFDKNVTAEIILGVSAKNVTVLYDLMKGSKVIERQQIQFNNENRKFIIPYKTEYGENVTAVFTYMIDGVFYQKTNNITKVNQPKNLSLKFSVFRDKLRPGQNEEWTIAVKNNLGKPVFAEVLASMYDASLDKLSSTDMWQINALSAQYLYPVLWGSIRPYWMSSVGYKRYPTVNLNYYFDMSLDKVANFAFDELNWFGFSFYAKRLHFLEVATTKPAAPSPASLSYPNSAENEVFREFKSNINISGGSASDEVEYKAEWAQTGVLDRLKKKQEHLVGKIRANFNETAFFFPQLKTNEKGETVISFTVPESNTTWNFRALAYDKLMNSGTLSATVVSRKELMLTPNMPRFVRQGDIAGISAKVSNMLEEAVSGKVKVEFFDPLTDKVLDIHLEKQYQDFSLEKGTSTSVNWLFNIPSDIDMIGCRIVAETENFSDGEQHVLSVLPNRILVTESMTMNMNGKQSKDFVFDKLVNHKSYTRENYKLTLEYAQNPAWYAIQALPVLSNPTNENAVNWFAGYYVNTLGASMMKQYPRVASMITAWQKQEGDKETLVSKLQKNEEVKSVLLEETPWVLEAKDESEQMSRLSLLFDLNNTSMQCRQAIMKLKDLQNADGAWSWYKGMYSSRSITQYILYGFTQLVKLGAVEYPTEVREMYINGLKYIDSQIKDDFQRLKKDNPNLKAIQSITTAQLEYLYVRSAYRDIPIDQQTREAERFYTSVVEKAWTKLNLYESSLLVVLARRNGNHILADKVLQSIKEHATINDEMGMFWANNRSNVFMSLSGVSVHTFVMDAFKQSKASESDMDMMKQWLLKQKQTQQWESTHATIDAVYALLNTGSDWFANEGNTRIILNKQLVKTQSKELGTGYIKQSWSKNEIDAKMGNVRIEKSDNGVAWGAIYWQYYEDSDKITAQKGELSIDKKLFVEKSTDKGESLMQITETNSLQIGDRVVVRLTVRVDRDMEFVQLKDMRASCFEPIETISGLKWQNSQYYYQSTKDASTNFFFDHLAKGTYVFEYPFYVNRAGKYSNGITTIQCMYAPEFVSHTNGMTVTVK